MSNYSKLPPIAVSLGGFAFNGEHIEYWKTQATKADREIASLRVQLAEEKAAVSALNGDVHNMGQQLADYRTVAAVREEYVGKLQAQLASARKALERLACRHVKGTPLWWQREAREAVSSLSDEKGNS